MVLPRLWHEMVLSLNPSSEAILTRVPMTTDWYREESLYQKVSTKKNIWRTTHQTVNTEPSCYLLAAQRCSAQAGLEPLLLRAQTLE
ncbi:uncharacterized protein RBU33_003651 isoform 3-T5 [Hipposideros larvatus]